MVNDSYIGCTLKGHCLILLYLLMSARSEPLFERCNSMTKHVKKTPQCKKKQGLREYVLRKKKGVTSLPILPKTT